MRSIEKSFVPFRIGGQIPLIVAISTKVDHSPVLHTKNLKVTWTQGSRRQVFKYQAPGGMIYHNCGIKWTTMMIQIFYNI